MASALLSLVVYLFAAAPDAGAPAAASARAGKPAVARAAAPPVTPVAGTPGQIVAVDMASTPWKLGGGARKYQPEGPAGGRLDLRLRGSMLGPPDKAGELLFDLRGTPLYGVSFNNRTVVSAEVRVSPEFVGTGKRNWYRSHRARLFLVDKRGKRLYLPSVVVVDRPRATDGWLTLFGRPSHDVPAALGSIDDGFDAGAVRHLGLNVEAFNREGEKVAGSVELRGLRVAFEAPTEPRVLPSDPAIIDGEAARAERMAARLAERCGVGPKGMAVGINLAWPSARSPEGEDMQLYGRLLDGGSKWFDKYWDLGEPEVQASLRTDFQEIRATFGKGAPVRVWLLGDLRTGMSFDENGDPVAVTERARANMKRLLDLASETEVVLVPVLLDFHLADGVARTGPDGAWQVNDRPDLITMPAPRARLVAALEVFVKAFAGHPAILAWDVMNEPENAVAVVTPAHFADLQVLLRELVDAVHRAGDLATIGHHNLSDPVRFFRGRAAVDLGQAHYYPFMETRPNPTRPGSKMTEGFGPLPAGWGELQLKQGQAAAQLAAAQRGGHRLLWWWSWRGHQETGDGFAVKPYADEIKRALARLPGRKP